jgi:hypothetical protein
LCNAPDAIGRISTCDSAVHVKARIELQVLIKLLLLLLLMLLSLLL